MTDGAHMTADEWTVDGKRITDHEVLSRLRQILDEESALIVEHRFYRGARAPHRFVCEDFDALQEYLQKDTRPGDSFHLWRFEDCCRDDNVIGDGKIPDSAGRVPTGGAY